MSGSHWRILVVFGPPSNAIVIDWKVGFGDVIGVADHFLENDLWIGSAQIDDSHPNAHLEVIGILPVGGVIGGRDKFMFDKFQKNREFLIWEFPFHPGKIAAEWIRGDRKIVLRL